MVSNNSVWSKDYKNDFDQVDKYTTWKSKKTIQFQPKDPMERDLLEMNLRVPKGRMSKKIWDELIKRQSGWKLDTCNERCWT